MCACDPSVDFLLTTYLPLLVHVVIEYPPMKKQKCIWSVEIQLDSDVTENTPAENVRAVQNFQVPPLDGAARPICVDEFLNMGNVLKRKSRSERRSVSENSEIRNKKSSNNDFIQQQTTTANFIDHSPSYPSALYKQTVSLLHPGTELCVKKPRFPNQLQGGFNTIGGLLTGMLFHFFTQIRRILNVSSFKEFLNFTYIKVN